MLNTPAIHMISSMLQGNPSKRPSVKKLLKDPFFTSGEIKFRTLHYLKKELLILIIYITYVCSCRIYAIQLANVLSYNGASS